MLLLLHRLPLAYLSSLMHELRADALLYIGLLLYFICGTFYVLTNGGMLLGALDIYAHAALLSYGLILPFIVLVVGIFRITHFLDRRRALGYRHMFGRRRVARFLAGTLLMLLVLMPFEAMFASVKTTFAEKGFPFESFAADLDKAIHFGHAPVKYLYAFAQNSWVLRVVEFNYDVVWFIICFGILYWAVISPRADGLRLRYCASFFLVWIIVGNIVAALLPTAGPAFYGLVTGDLTRFQHLRDFVASGNDWFASAAAEQQYLWSLHEAGVSGFGSGISAFPSVHVALISINAMFLSELGRRAAIVAWTYVAFIVTSSIYLGWHYAIDGYTGIVLAVLIYWLVRLSMQLPSRLAPRAAALAGVPQGLCPRQQTER